MGHFLVLGCIALIVARSVSSTVTNQHFAHPSNPVYVSKKVVPQQVTIVAFFNRTVRHLLDVRAELNRNYEIDVILHFIYATLGIIILIRLRGKKVNWK